MARRDLPGLRAAAASLSDASRERIHEVGTEHPLAFALVANMAATEIVLARAEGSPARLEREMYVLEGARCGLQPNWVVITHGRRQPGVAWLLQAPTRTKSPRPHHFPGNDAPRALAQQGPLQHSIP